MGRANLSNQRTHGVGMLIHDWMDYRRPGRRAAMTLDQLLNLGVLIAIVTAVIVIVAGEVIQRWRRR